MTEAQLYSYLAADAGITTITTRIFNGELPENTALPALTLQYLSEESYSTFDGDSGSARSRYRIQVWARTYATAQSLKSAVISAMSRYPRLILEPLHEEEISVYRFALDYQVFN